MKILITGASGLLGVNLAMEASKHHTVTGVFNKRSLSNPPFNVVEQDLLADGAIKRLLDQVRPDWVIHCAALADIDQSEAHPDLVMRLNADVPGKLAKETARRGLRLLHISTDAVFDGTKGDYSEEDAPNPLSTYARSKLAGETQVQAVDPFAAIVRVNLFGWSVSGSRSLAEVFLNNLAAGRAIRGFTDVNFCPMLATDLAGVLLNMLDRGLAGVYHAVGSTCTTKYLFGLAVAQRFGFAAQLVEPISVKNAGLAARRSLRLTLRTTKLAKALGSSLPDWEVGLERLYEQWQAGYAAQVRQMGKGAKNS